MTPVRPALVPADPGTALGRRDPGTETVAAFLETQTPRTRLEYGKSLAVLAAHLHERDTAALARRLFSLSPGDANGIVLGWRNAMRDAGLSPATVNCRLAAVRSLVKFGRMLGVCAFTLDVPGLKKGNGVQDRRGPNPEEYARLIEACRDFREEAILRLLGDRGLRRAEVATLRLEDWDDQGEFGVLRVLRKGEPERVRLTIHGAALAAVRRYLGSRVAESPWLFVTRLGTPMEGWGIYEMMKSMSTRAGLGYSPHALRHRAVTNALDKSNGDVRSVAAFAGHRSVRTTLQYDDQRRDAGERIARLVGEE